MYYFDEKHARPGVTPIMAKGGRTGKLAPRARLGAREYSHGKIQLPNAFTNQTWANVEKSCVILEGHKTPWEPILALVSRFQ